MGIAGGAPVTRGHTVCSLAGWVVMGHTVCSLARWVVMGHAVCLLATLAGCARSPQVPRDQLHILLITLDTTRADVLGCYGSREGLTPNLDALAGDGVLFDAVAPVPLTTPSHASILTGLYPFHHGVRMNGFFRLDREHVTLAEILKPRGMTTGAVLAAYVLARLFQLDQGFEFYDDDLSRGLQKTVFSIIERRADAVTASAFEWLDDQTAAPVAEGGARPFFLWLHYFDPHAPYEPPKEFDLYGTDPLGKYKGEIAYTDHEIGRVVAKLKEMDLYDRTVIVVAGDHGEAFGRHGEHGHGLVIYESTLRVPLILRIPDVEGFSCRRGARMEDRASLVDIAPTLLDLLGVQAPRATDGRSLLPLIQGAETTPERPVYAETAEGKLVWQWSQLAAVYSGPWKLILAPSPELYNLREDRFEERNLAPAEPARVERMTNLLSELVSAPGVRVPTATFEMDADAEERLRSLGYISGSSLEDKQLEEIEIDLVTACRTGRNANEMTGFTNLITMTMNHLQWNQPGRALRSAKKAREMIGEDRPKLLGFMAAAFNQLRLFDSAIEAYEKMLEQRPNELGVLGNLAVTHHNKGNSTQAIEILNDVIRRSPQDYYHRLNLANMYDDLGRYDAADRQYANALELAPTTAGQRNKVRYNLALSLMRRGRLAQARDLLEQILDEWPDREDARTLLGKINQRMGSSGSSAR